MFEFLEGSDDEPTPARVKIVGVGDFGEEVLDFIYQDAVGNAEILSVSSEEDLIDVEGMLEETDLVFIISRAEDELAKRLSRRAKSFDLPLKIGVFDSNIAEDFAQDLDAVIVSSPEESAHAIIGITNLIRTDSIVALELLDIHTILHGLENKTVLVLTSEDLDAESAVRSITDSPRLRDKLERGKKFIIYIAGSSDRLTMLDIAEATGALQSIAPEDSEIIWGARADDEQDDRIHITILAVGFEE